MVRNRCFANIVLDPIRIARSTIAHPVISSEHASLALIADTLMALFGRILRSEPRHLRQGQIWVARLYVIYHYRVARQGRHYGDFLRTPVDIGEYFAWVRFDESAHPLAGTEDVLGVGRLIPSCLGTERHQGDAVAAVSAHGQAFQPSLPMACRRSPSAATFG